MEIKDILSDAVKKSISSEEEVEIIEDSKKTFTNSFSNKKKRKYNPKSYANKKLSSWTQRDFALYIHNEYRNIYKSDIPYTLGSVTTYMSNIKGSLYENLGYFNNKILKDYIDYFISEWLSFYKNELKTDKWLFYMRKSDPLKSFCDNYEEIKLNKKSYKKEDAIDKGSIKDIHKDYLLGLESCLLRHGIIYTINYLILYNKISEQKSIKMVEDILKKSYNTKGYEKMIQSTKENNCIYKDFTIKTLENFNLDLPLEKNDKNFMEII